MVSCTDWSDQDDNVSENELRMQITHFYMQEIGLFHTFHFESGFGSGKQQVLTDPQDQWGKYSIENVVWKLKYIAAMLI